MPAKNRLRIWLPRILVIVWIYLACIWTFEATAKCFSSDLTPRACTPTDAYIAIGHGLKAAGPILFIGLILGGVAAFEMVSMFWLMARGRSYTIYPHEYEATFDDVRGQGPVVDSVKEVVRLFRGFQEFKRLGGFPPHGLLFEGPPGTGKTLLGKAVAGEVGVPFIYTSATGFSNMFMGVGNLRVMALFRRAKKFVRQYDGAVIFIDEIDALGSRSGQVQSASTPHSGLLGRIERFFSPGGGQGAGIVNELLVQMDGMVQPKKGIVRPIRRLLHMKPSIPSYNILVMAATNRAQALDPALLRPGRFDRKIHVGLPDKEGRKDVIAYYLTKVRHEPIDVDKFAQSTIGYSPARLKNIINEALIVALQDHRQALSWDDITQAKLIDEIGLKQPVKYTDKEKIMTAVHEAGHAVVAHELRNEASRIDVITIIKRQEALGLVSSTEREERFSSTKEDLVDIIRVKMAGMVAEEIWFGTSTSGVGGDLHQATMLALQYVGMFGMGKRLISYNVIPVNTQGEQTISFMLSQPEIREEVDALLKQCKAEVTDLLRKRRFAVERIRDALLEREELVGDQLETLMTEIFTEGVAARTAAELPPASQS